MGLPRSVHVNIIVGCGVVRQLEDVSRRAKGSVVLMGCCQLGTRTYTEEV
jgi:hypothetical protein